MESLLDTIKHTLPGRRLDTDPKFAAGDAICGPFKILGIIDVEIEEDFPEFSCKVHGCLKKLSSLLDLEQHYNVFHRYECNECHKHLASAHLLDLHICETHDSFFELQSSKKPMYGCFVAECDVKSWNAKERIAHCVEAHNFPPNFRFDRGPQSNANNSNSMDVDVPAKTKAKKQPKKKQHQKDTNSIKTTHPPVLGGGRRGRGRHVPSWHQQVTAPSCSNVTSVIDMQDLESTLPPL